MLHENDWKSHNGICFPLVPLIAEALANQRVAKNTSDVDRNDF